MKKMITMALLILIALWLCTRPAVVAQAKNMVSIVQELTSEAQETLVKTPVDQAKEQYIKDAQKQALEAAEIHQKQLDAEIDKITQPPAEE